ncbi:hypothetical protein BGZ61DRAFT_486108 [Ilyonectria robusta]|uniref:uncharacterized protein n=1 Tax=Ilyonectria robusta TaxID=1079257 RepID=UPI001E8DB3C6|nr:uncharacterized protein BGZ61DRAFT_486108 [Ilyonectria robusta]KAH8658928.1 hypothetical protein BGZ61DRAFT_486108 [Ilyonectria robusta]
MGGFPTQMLRQIWSLISNGIRARNHQSHFGRGAGANRGVVLELVGDIQSGGTSVTSGELFRCQTYIHADRDCSMAKKSHIYCAYTKKASRMSKYQTGETLLVVLDILPGRSEPSGRSWQLLLHHRRGYSRPPGEWSRCPGAGAAMTEESRHRGTTAKLASRPGKHGDSNGKPPTQHSQMAESYGRRQGTEPRVRRDREPDEKRRETARRGQRAPGGATSDAKGLEGRRIDRLAGLLCGRAPKPRPRPATTPVGVLDCLLFAPSRPVTKPGLRPTWATFLALLMASASAAFSLLPSFFPPSPSMPPPPPPRLPRISLSPSYSLLVVPTGIPISLHVGVLPLLSASYPGHLISIPCLFRSSPPATIIYSSGLPVVSVSSLPSPGPNSSESESEAPSSGSEIMKDISGVIKQELLDVEHLIVCSTVRGSLIMQIASARFGPEMATHAASTFLSSGGLGQSVVNGVVSTTSPSSSPSSSPNVSDSTLSNSAPASHPASSGSRLSAPPVTAPTAVSSPYIHLAVEPSPTLAAYRQYTSALEAEKPQDSTPNGTALAPIPGNAPANRAPTTRHPLSITPATRPSSQVTMTWLGTIIYGVSTRNNSTFGESIQVPEQRRQWTRQLDSGIFLCSDGNESDYMMDQLEIPENRDCRSSIVLLCAGSQSRANPYLPCPLRVNRSTYERCGHLPPTTEKIQYL